MSEGIRQIIAATVERAPDWIRRDLAGKDEAARRRAEEALAAMIAGALSTPPTS